MIVDSKTMASLGQGARQRTPFNVLNNFMANNVQAARGGANRSLSTAERVANNSGVSNTDSNLSSLQALNDYISNIGNANLGNPANGQRELDSNSLTALRQNNADFAKYGDRSLNLKADISKESAAQQQGYFQSNANQANEIYKQQRVVDSDLNMNEADQKYNLDMNLKNQDYFNDMSKGVQTVKDNENQRQYDLAGKTIDGISNIYMNGMPQNLIAGMR